MCNGNCSCKSQKEKTVYILRGLPGSGKTTLAKKLTKTNCICEADQFMIDNEGNYSFNPLRLEECHLACFAKFKELIDKNESIIVVSNTNTLEWEFQQYQKYAEEKEYFVHIFIVENRHGNNSIHNVPEKTLAAMRHKFDIHL